MALFIRGQFASVVKNFIKRNWLNDDSEKYPIFLQRVYEAEDRGFQQFYKKE